MLCKISLCEVKYHIKLCIKDSKHMQGVENTLSQKESIKIFCERVQFLIKQLDLIKNDLLTYILKHFVSILRNCILRFKVSVLSPIFKNKSMNAHDIVTTLCCCNNVALTLLQSLCNVAICSFNLLYLLGFV